MPDVPDPSDHLAGMRRSYEAGGLAEEDLAATWLEQLQRWLSEAESAGITEPNAMVLATAGADGQPAARTVLLKGLDERGLVLYTNYGSRKGTQAAESPFGAVVLPWIALQRQVLVRGRLERTSPEESDAYFHSRPHGSQLGAVASPQSRVIGSRAELEARRAELEREFPEGTTVPRPEGWGGLRLLPEEVEFWQGRPDRLHDRLRYRRVDGPSAEGWVVERLAP